MKTNTTAPDPPQCPHCNGPMPSPKSVTHLQPNGIPRSEYVCRHCWREWMQAQRERHKQRKEVMRLIA
jgi:hypothetical protein